MNFKNFLIKLFVTIMGLISLFRHLNTSTFSNFLIIISFFIFNFDYANAQVSAADSVTQGQKKHLGNKQNPWSGMVQWLTQKNQDYLSDYFSGVNLGAGYAYSDKITFYGLMGYQQPLTDNPEKIERFGTTDLEIGLNTSPFYKNKFNFQVSATSSINLPTSEMSQRSSLQGSWNGGVVTTTPLKYGLRVSSVHILNLNAYEYETANVMGTVYNQPYSLSNIITGIWSQNLFYSTISASWIYFRDYADSNINIQSLRTAIGYNLSKKNRIEIYGRWRDRIISNNPVFADGTTFFGLMLTVNI